VRAIFIHANGKALAARGAIEARINACLHSCKILDSYQGMPSGMPQALRHESAFRRGGQHWTSPKTAKATGQTNSQGSCRQATVSFWLAFAFLAHASRCLQSKARPFLIYWPSSP